MYGIGTVARSGRPATATQVHRTPGGTDQPAQQDSSLPALPPAGPLWLIAPASRAPPTPEAGHGAIGLGLHGHHGRVRGHPGRAAIANRCPAACGEAVGPAEPELVLHADPWQVPQRSTYLRPAAYQVCLNLFRRRRVEGILVHLACASRPSVHRAEIGQARSRSPKGEWLAAGVEDDSGGQLVAESPGEPLDAAEVLGPDGFCGLDLARDEFA